MKYLTLPGYGIIEMKCSVLFFARARDLAGTPSLEVELEPGATVGRLRDRLVDQFPSLADLNSSLLWAVNNTYVSDRHLLSADDVVACFPPVSGG